MTEDPRKQDEKRDPKRASDRSRKTEKNASHEKELKATKHVKERDEAKKPSGSETTRKNPPPPPVPAPRTPERTLESVVSEKRSEQSETEKEPLETRVARSTDPKDLERMRRLAQKVYHDGWNRLSTDEQLAFIYHSRFLDYLSSKEREREDVRSTMYQMIGAQGKSLGLTSRYSSKDIGFVTDRFTQAMTPLESGLYKRPATDTYKSDERRR